MRRLARWIDRWKKKPRFRTPGAGALPAVLLLLLLLLLRREPAPPVSRSLPAPAPVPHIEPPPVQVQPEPPVTAPPPEPVRKACPEGCAVPPAGCDIKGNISTKTGERIYHLPGQRWYDETKITPGKGEAWFCTEAEARANGWRKSRV
jgi:hypothetical protein